jgi:hypothetical protein
VLRFAPHLPLADMADSCQEEIALLTPALRRGSAEFSSCVGGELQDSGRGFCDGLHLATVDQAEIRGLVTTGHSVRRGAASDFLSSVTLIALPRLAAKS